jgi:hypothetical protein
MLEHAGELRSQREVGDEGRTQATGCSDYRCDLRG